MARALTHDTPYLTKVMLTYATEYSKYSSSFTKLLQACSEKVGDGPGAEVLKENLEEEMGDNKLGEAELEALGKLGIPSNSVEGVAHKQIFADFVEAIRRHVEDGEPYATARSGSTPGQTFLNRIQSLIDDCPAHVGLAVLAYSAELLVEPQSCYSRASPTIQISPRLRRASSLYTSHATTATSISLLPWWRHTPRPRPNARRSTRQL